MKSAVVTGAHQILSCSLHYKKISTDINIPGLNELFASRKFAAILGGNSSDTQANRFSYWAAEPREIFEFHSGQSDPFGKLSSVLGKYKLDSNSRANLPAGIFCGGWLGYFAYELGRYIERLPAQAVDDIKMPLVRLCFYDRLICYDRIEKNCWLFALQIVNDNESADEKLAGLETILTESEKISVAWPGRGDLRKIDFSQIRANMSREYYIDALDRIKRYIYDGEVYQINFSQRFEYDFNARPMDLFAWQSFYNPCPYGAYIEGGDFQIVSASPEMFITITDGIISTKPIKGTRPRTGKAPVDSRNFNELLNSSKEKAELNMIIDLERNDLARICEPGTRKVIQPRTIETYPTVFHAVATVAGRLRPEVSFCDVLKAVFPGGSITGAPKVRSMEIIDELEPTQRGVYTGSIGFIGIDDNACLNIAIRTIIITKKKAYAQTGGGIVADSDPGAEWDETITKASALLAGIKSVRRPARQRLQIRDTRQKRHRKNVRKSFSE
jgi:para-aminobenzoate synthetase component 1